MKFKHLFGPVMSRRLGVSLGVDLIPYKHCSLNCVYCEVQNTTHLTMQRSEFYPVSEILAELDIALADLPHLDYITFSGAGEPTLYSRIGEIITYIKANYPAYKLALITNSTLLKDEKVRREVSACDIALPSLDAATDEAFFKINRPVPNLKARDIINGLIDFRKEFAGSILLEVFIIPGINDNEEELELLAEAIHKIKPDVVQLNSLDRPGTEAWVQAAPLSLLKEIKSFFESRISSPIEIVSKAQCQASDFVLDEDLIASILQLIKRRPCTAEDISKSLAVHINEISKILRQLHLEEKVSVNAGPGGVYYSCT